MSRSFWTNFLACMLQVSEHLSIDKNAYNSFYFDSCDSDENSRSLIWTKHDSSMLKHQLWFSGPFIKSYVKRKSWCQQMEDDGTINPTPWFSLLILRTVGDQLCIYNEQATGSIYDEVLYPKTWRHTSHLFRTTSWSFCQLMCIYYMFTNNSGSHGVILIMLYNIMLKIGEK